MRQRSLEELESLYARHGLAMFHYALCVLGSVDEVEEAMQEVFLKAAANARRIARARSARAYLFAMLRHEMARRMKRRGNDAPLGVEHLETPREGGLCEEDARQVENALSGLPAEQREVVVLKIYEGLTFREIAEVTGAPADTAASRYRYAIEKLRTRLGHKVKGE